MRSRLVLLVSAILLFGCGQRQAQIPEGCYRFDDGQPFLRIVENRGEFTTEGSVKSFVIGQWRDAKHRSVQITPAFFLHDGTASPPAGPKRMAQPVRSLQAGAISYVKQDDSDVLLIPVEAYGEARLIRGGSC